LQFPNENIIEKEYLLKVIRKKYQIRDQILDLKLLILKQFII